MDIKKIRPFCGLLLFIFSVFLPYALGAPTLLFLREPFKVRMVAKTPARLALEVFRGQHILHSPESMVTLNDSLARIQKPKVPKMVLPPIKIKWGEARDLARPRIVVGAKNTKDQWSKKELVFSGPLELSPEAALGPGRQLEIKWRGRGKDISLGQANIGWKNSHYEVKSPYLGGEILAQVTDETGSVIGEGRLPLNSHSPQSFMGGTPIKIEPTQGEISFKDFYKATSGSKDSNQVWKPKRVQVVKANSQEDDDKFVYNGLTSDSTTLLQGRQTGYIDTLVAVSSRSKENMYMFPERFIHNLNMWIKNLVTEELPNSLVFGQTLGKKNKSLAGIRVVIDSLDNHSIFYLNELYIPDPRLKATSETGMFIVYGLKPGLYTWQGKALDQTVLSSYFVVQESSVGQTKGVLSEASLQYSLQVFDAFNGQKESAYISHHALSDEFLVRGQSWLSLPENPANLNIMVLNPLSSDYLTATYFVSHKKPEFDLPLIKKEWIDYVRMINRVNHDDKRNGSIIGFFSDNSGEVNLNTQINNYEIIYFNHKGERVLEPLVGGGYLIFGVDPDKVHILTIDYQESDPWSQVVSVKPGEYLVTSPSF